MERNKRTPVHSGRVIETLYVRFAKAGKDSIYSDSLNESNFYSVIGILRSGIADMENQP